MPNEFIVKNGLISQGNVTVSGSISTTSPVNLSGFATGSVLFTSGSAGVITGSSNLFWDNTNSRLGLNCIPTTDKLEIYGNIRFQNTLDYLKFANDLVAIKRSANRMDLYAYSGWDFYDTLNSISRLRISTTGNVLINTTTDAGAKMTLRGSGATSATTALRVENTNASSSMVVLDNGNVGIGNSNPSKKLHILGDVKIQTTTPPNSSGSSTIEFNPEFSTPVYIQAISNFGPTSPTAYSGGFKFIVQNRDASLANPYYSIDALAILANGNIGVNTITPTASLHVKGAGSGSITTAFLVENTNASASIVVLDNGNVGIGTSNPTVTLDALGSEFRFAASTGNINFYNTPGVNSHFNFINVRQDSDYIFRQNRNGVVNTTSLILKGNTGNVLINTTTDAGFRLDVNGTARVSGLFYVTQILNNANQNLVIESGGSSTFVQIKPRTGATDGVRIETDQTDAGTTGEWSSFRVVGPIFAPTSGTRIRNFLSITPTINQTGGANGITRGLYVSASIISASDWRAIETTTGSVLFNGGRVGIGTSSPSTSLDVSGSGRFTNGLTVTGSIASTVLTGSDTRVVVADTQGNLQSSDQILIEAFLNATGSAAITLNNTASWDTTGSYIGTPVTDTYQGQQYYNNSYYFIAVDDNTWIRLLRG